MSNRLMREMMREAVKGMMQGSNQQSVRDSVHSAGMRKARMVAAQQSSNQEGTERRMQKETQITPEKRKSMLRCSAFVGLCLSAALSTRQERYRFEVDAIAKPLKALWDDLATMPQSARDQVFAALNMSLGEKGMPALQEVFQRAGIEVGSSTSCEDEEL